MTILDLVGLWFLLVFAVVAGYLLGNRIKIHKTDRQKEVENVR